MDSTMTRGGVVRLLFLLFAAGLCGTIWSMRETMSPNDRARWDTIWSLAEFNTYQIFDTSEEAAKNGKPEQYFTIDKVSYDGKYFSSKPPLLPTVLAGVVKVLRCVGPEISKETKGDSTKGTAQIYFKAVLYLINVAPFLLFLAVYYRYVQRFARTDFSRTLSLASAALGTLITGYLTTLNNHTVAAWSAGFTAFALMTIWYDGRREPLRFALAGLFAGWTAANELPAALFSLVALAIAAKCDWKRTVLFFLPPLIFVCAAFFWTNHQSFGSYVPAYLQKELYDYEGSYWRSQEKSNIDALSDPDEAGNFAEGPRIGKIFFSPAYFVNMTIGHHGLFSLTPIWLFAVAGGWFVHRGRAPSLAGLHWPILFVSTVLFLFYCCVNSERNYGGFCHGMRWLVWLAPLWLLFLPTAFDEAADSPRGRIYAYACLAVSVFTVGDAWYNPWTYSWLHRIFVWFGISSY